MFVLAAHMTVHAPLVGAWPALPLGCMISAHEATAAEVFAADINGALMDAQVAALRVIAHTLATLDTIHGPRLTLMMARSNLNIVDVHLIILRHIDGHTDGHI